MLSWVSELVLAYCIENVRPARCCPLGIEFEKGDSSMAWLTIGQKFQGVGLKLKAFIFFSRSSFSCKSKNHESAWLVRFEVGEFLPDLGFSKIIVCWILKNGIRNFLKNLKIPKSPDPSIQDELILS